MYEELVHIRVYTTKPRKKLMRCQLSNHSTINKSSLNPMVRCQLQYPELIASLHNSVHRDSLYKTTETPFRHQIQFLGLPKKSYMTSRDSPGYIWTLQDDIRAVRNGCRKTGLLQSWKTVHVRRVPQRTGRARGVCLESDRAHKNGINPMRIA